MLSLVLPLCSCKKSLVLSSFRQLKTAIRPPFSLLQAEQGRVSLLPCKDELLTRVPFAGAGVLFQQSFLASWFPVCPFARGSSVPGAILCICFCWTLRFLSVHVANVLTVPSFSPPDLVNIFICYPTEHNFFFFKFLLDTMYSKLLADHVKHDYYVQSKTSIFNLYLLLKVLVLQNSCHCGYHGWSVLHSWRAFHNRYS